MSPDSLKSSLNFCWNVGIVVVILFLFYNHKFFLCFIGMRAVRDSVETLRILITEDHKQLCICIFVLFCGCFILDIVEKIIQYNYRPKHVVT